MKVLCEACGALAEARLLGRPGGAVLLCSSCGAETAVPVEPKLNEPALLPADEEAAFSALRARWDDEEAHRAFLSRFADLEGLARAGARYREVLAESPLDGPATRARDEILKRATALGLRELPGPGAPNAAPRAIKWGAVALLVGALFGAAVWVVYTLVAIGAMH
jgi:hypothetical protein